MVHIVSVIVDLICDTVLPYRGTWSANWVQVVALGLWGVAAAQTLVERQLEELIIN